MIRRPPRSPLFPYTPLFRSNPNARTAPPPLRYGPRRGWAQVLRPSSRPPRPREWTPGMAARRIRSPRSTRSEEHTSELQSHLNLVCRLLLEKKKRKSVIRRQLTPSSDPLLGKEELLRQLSTTKYTTGRITRLIFIKRLSVSRSIRESM